MDWLSVVWPAEPGETLQTNANRVNGITVVSSRKDCPGTTSVSRMARVPCLVFMVPVVPTANGPLSVIDCTSGFHSGQVLVSDQSFHAVWGIAFVSTERSLLAIRRLPLLFGAARRPAIQQKVYHAGHDEADEVAKVRVPEPRGKWPVGFQAEHLELFGDEEQRNTQPDQPRD